VHPTLFREFTADMNGDGQIDLADAIIIIYMDLDAQEGGRAVRRDGDVNVDMAANNRVWLSGKDGRIALQLDNETAFVGMQCDITLPMGATLSDLRLEDGRSEGHTLLYNQTGADTYRVVVYPSTASAFCGSTGSLLSFATMGQQGTVKVENIFFVDTQMKKHTFADLSDETTGIGGVARIDDNIGDVYDLQGRKANTQSSMLKKGVYIINGKKQVK
jgi:hypothetical protein